MRKFAIACGLLTLGFIAAIGFTVAHADISNPHPTPPSNSITSTMLQAGIVSDTNVSTVAHITVTKLGNPGDNKAIPFGNGNQLGTSTLLTFDPTINTFGSTGSTTLGATTTINSVQYVWTGSQGAANTVLKNDGSGNITWGSSPASDTYTFLSSGTWTKPTTVGASSTVEVLCWGAGGGGSNSGAANNAGSGGGGGGFVSAIFKASSLTSTVSVTIGAGGTPTVAGGNSTFGSYLTCYGGSGAYGTNNGSSGGGGGALAAGGTPSSTNGGVGGSPLGGANTGGDSNMGGGGGCNGAPCNGGNSYYGGGGGSGGTAGGTGANGGASFYGGGGGGSGGYAGGGAGGTSVMGGAGGAGGAGSNGGNGVQPGGGGGGADSNGGGSNKTGGTGGAGEIIVLTHL